MADTVQITFDLRLGDQAVRVSLEAPTAPIRARRLLPFFHGIAHQVIDAAVGEAEAQDRRVSCKAGCGACCRQIVPVSKTEARQLSALVDAMPEPRRTAIRARFVEALARLEEAELLEAVRELDPLVAQKDLLSPRYLALRIACPFLEDESCSIHAQRPSVCREYLVTTPAERCANPTPETVRTIPLRAHVSRALVMLEGHPPIALVHALEWAQAHADDEPASRPTVEWIDIVLHDMAGGKTTERAEPPAP